MEVLEWATTPVTTSRTAMNTAAGVLGTGWDPEGAAIGAAAATRDPIGRRPRRGRLPRSRTVREPAGVRMAAEARTTDRSALRSASLIYHPGPAALTALSFSRTANIAD